MHKLKKYKKCKVIFDDDLEFPFDIKPVQIMLNSKGQIYSRARTKELDKKMVTNLDKFEGR